MAPMSAPMFIVFAMRTRLAIVRTTFLEYFFFMTAANPLPVTRPIRAHISWTTTIVGYRNNANHSITRPNCAPACKYVPIVDGSSSAAPVINPGSNDLMISLNDSKKDLYDRNIVTFYQ